MSDAQETLDRALPFRESWRSKTVRDMDEDERRFATTDTEEAERVARLNYHNPPADWDRDDMIWAYEAWGRAKQLLKDLKEAANRFDVV